MITWILILSMMGKTYNSGDAPSVSAVGGFTTREACIRAGIDWNRQMNRMNPAVDTKALCVRSNKP